VDDISGTIRGYRVFTACRTYRGKIFRIEDHLDRLYRFASNIYMKPPMDRDSLRQLLTDVVDRNRQAGIDADLLLDIVFSGGLSGSTMKQSGKPSHLYVAVQELEHPAPEFFVRGMALATFPHQRIYPNVKLLNYVGAVLAHQSVVPEHDADDVLFIDPRDGQTILEGSTFTVFFIDTAGGIVTPPLNGKILDSITRRVVLELLARREEFVVREVPVSTGQLASLSEAFIVSTSRNVVPVTRIDATVIGDGKPGPVTARVSRIFQDYLDSC
jgi:branched-subunit amino acid aminotransferase/4-amino-4-deoxychorismate lyase